MDYFAYPIFGAFFKLNLEKIFFVFFLIKHVNV